MSYPKKLKERARQLAAEKDMSAEKIAEIFSKEAGRGLHDFRPEPRTIRNWLSRAKKQEEKGTLLAKAKEQHCDDIEFLLEKWYEMNRHVIPLIEDIVVYSEFDHYDWEVALLLLGSARSTWIGCLREHLSHVHTLWTNDASRISKFKSYEKACRDLAQQIREEGESWPNVRILHCEFERPLIFLIACKQLREIINFSEFPEEAPDYEGIKWWAREDTLLAEFRTRVWGMPHRENVALKRVILQADRPLDYVKTYEAMCSRFLKSASVTSLLKDFLELEDLRDKISHSLDEIMIRRDYITTNCRLCPK